MDYNHAVPSRLTPLTRPLMVRQPYSEAVKSDREERFPLFPWGEKTEKRGGASLKVKEGRVGFRKKPSLMGKSGANERNESSLSNCRVQPAL